MCPPPPNPRPPHTLYFKCTVTWTCYCTLTCIQAEAYILNILWPVNKGAEQMHHPQQTDTVWGLGMFTLVPLPSEASTRSRSNWNRLERKTLRDTVRQATRWKWCFWLQGFSYSMHNLNKREAKKKKNTRTEWTDLLMLFAHCAKTPTVSLNDVISVEPNEGLGSEDYHWKKKTNLYLNILGFKCLSKWF